MYRYLLDSLQAGSTIAAAAVGLAAAELAAVAVARQVKEMAFYR